MGRGWRGAALYLGCALLLSGCMGRSPRTIANQYVSALKKNQYSVCYAMLAEADRKATPLKHFVADMPLTPDVTPAWFESVLAASQYSVGNARRHGDRAHVPVRITTPDLPLFERTVEASVGPDGDPGPAARESLATGDYPKITYTDDLVLIHEHHHWRILGGFAARSRAAAIRRRALEFYYRGELQRAIAAYGAAISKRKDSDASGGWGLEFLYGRELGEIKDDIVDSAASRAYVNQLKVSNIRTNMSAAHHPAVFGRITNSGSRPIDAVRMKVTFYKGEGDNRVAVFSEQHVPISTPLEFTDFTVKATPLMPGETRKFGFNLDAPAPMQENADPYVSVDGIIFTQPQLMPSAQELAAPSATVTPRSSSGQSGHGDD
ncbi:MAG: hypothetical protein ACREP6_10425 [Candidatus Binataceae bacterium]